MKISNSTGIRSIVKMIVISTATLVLGWVTYGLLNSLFLSPCWVLDIPSVYNNPKPFFCGNGMLIGFMAFIIIIFSVAIWYLLIRKITERIKI